MDRESAEPVARMHFSSQRRQARVPPIGVALKQIVRKALVSNMHRNRHQEKRARNYECTLNSLSYSPFRFDLLYLHTKSKAP